MPENFENAALFLPFGLPSTLIRHENGAFENALDFKPEEFENAGFAFKCGRKNWLVIELCFQISFSVDREHLPRFQSEISVYQISAAWRE